MALRSHHLLDQAGPHALQHQRLAQRAALLAGVRGVHVTAGVLRAQHLAVLADAEALLDRTFGLGLGHWDRLVGRPSRSSAAEPDSPFTGRGRGRSRELERGPTDPPRASDWKGEDPS